MKEAGHRVVLACVAALAIAVVSSKETVCKKFSPFLYGKVTYTSDSLEPGTEAFFECDDHAVLVPNETSSFCLNNGEWHITPECRRLCNLPEVKNGKLEYQNTSEPNGTIESGVTLKTICNFGYEVETETHQQITCRNGQIDSPKCVPKPCQLPKRSENVRYYLGGVKIWHSKVRHDSEISVSCSTSEYELAIENEEDSTINYPSSFSSTCKFGEMEPEIFPTCKERRCNLPEVKNGKLEYQNTSEASGKIESGVTLKTICNFGYEVETETHQQITCRNGQIDSPKCVPECRGTVSNGKIINDVGTWHVKCDEGYSLSVSATPNEFVNRGGKLFVESNELALQCLPTECNAPYMENVLITNPRDKYSVGESVDLACGLGARLEGDQQLRCLSSGMWGGSAFCRGKINYLITVKTGTIRGAGTDADVYIQLFGENNQHTEDAELTHDTATSRNKFEKGHEDKFFVKLRDVGDIFKIRIRVDDRNIGNILTGYWYLEYISINVTERQKSYMFPVNAWLSDNNETYEFYTKVPAEIEYRIEMETWGFTKGTPLFIQLIGANGHLTEEADLTNNLKLIAKRGVRHTYEYIFRRQPDLVKISKLLIRFGGTKHWFLFYVKINVPERQEVYTFQIKKWITEPDQLYELLT